MNCHTLDPVYLLEQYELLRREALALPTDTQRGYGLMLFLTRGMVAWMAALSCLSGPATHAASDSTLDPLPVSVRPQITTILANMVLVCMQEGPK